MQKLKASGQTEKRGTQIVNHHVDQAVAKPLKLRQAHEAVLKLSLLSAQLKMGGDAGFDFFRLERLGDIVHPAAGQGADFVLHPVQRTDEEHGHILQLRAQLELPTHLKPVHPRQHHIQND